MKRFHTMDYAKCRKWICKRLNGVILLSKHINDTVADFKYGVNTDVNISVSVSRAGNTLFEVMGIC